MSPVTVERIREAGLHARLLAIINERAVPTPAEIKEIKAGNRPRRENSTAVENMLTPVVNQHGLMSVATLKCIGQLEARGILRSGLYPELVDLQKRVLRQLESRRKLKSQSVTSKKPANGKPKSKLTGAKRGRKFKETKFGDTWPVPLDNLWAWGMGRDFHRLLSRKSYTYREILEMAKVGDHGFNVQGIRRYWRFYTGPDSRRVGYAVRIIGEKELPGPGVVVSKRVKVKIVKLKRTLNL